MLSLYPAHWTGSTGLAKTIYTLWLASWLPHKVTALNKPIAAQASLQVSFVLLLCRA